MKLFLAVFMAACILVFSLTACTLEIKTTPGPEATPPATVSAAETPPDQTIVPSPSPSPTSEPTPAETINMYTSYADMVSFDPSTGVAQFDYWNMLRGSDAVQYLVENKGYSQADAQAEVDNYADSEFIKSNTNPQLRAVDLSTVRLRMMYHPDGTMLTGAEPVETTFYDFCGLYADNPDLVLHSFFYNVIVDSDGTISVDQVYWP